MKLEFWGTDQELNQFKKKYKELAEYVTHMGEDISYREEYSKTKLEIQKDIEDMNYIKDKLVFLVDKLIRRI